MNTNHNRKKKLITSALGAVAAAVAAPALLFVGAGTAQADNVYVDDASTFGGVTMTVESASVASDLHDCVYSATPPWGIPYVSPPFEMNSSNRLFQWFIPSLQTNTTWNIAVLCDGVPQTVLFKGTPAEIIY
jgi:hypothetical protein